MRARDSKAEPRACHIALADGRWLRLLDESDTQELYAVVEANRAYLARWMPWAAEQTPHDTAAFIRHAREQLTRERGFQTAIIEDGRIVGVVGFHGVSWEHRSTSIGYWLAESSQGHGIMTRAVKALLQHAFVSWQLHRVEIRAGVENARSRAIPERLGFTEEGIAREAELIGDHYFDQVVYSILAREMLPSDRGVAAAEDLARTGGHDAPVEIADYDPTWPAAYEAERERLAPLLDGVEIHHIGSTAVAGLAAKPVIDMIALVDAYEPLISRLVNEAGYQYPRAFNATLPRRRFLCYPSPELRTHHVHLVDDPQELARYLDFRDRLRDDPALAAEYEALKRTLAERYHDDRETYTKAKGEFVRGHERPKRSRR